MTRRMHSLEINPAADESATPTATAAPVFRAAHAEGDLARVIEQQAAKLPSDWFLVAAFAAMGASLALELSGRQRASRFVGQWPAPLLIMGVYNKLVKTVGTR